MALPEIWMRITLSDKKYEPTVIPVNEPGWGGAGPEGGYKYGETEDYIFVPEIIIPPELDFGDAPDQYPTVLAVDGARHIIGGPYFGPDDDYPDSEPNGQPTNLADGDDSDGNDDEDGVTIPVLIQGQSAIINLDINGGGGYVDAWIDFNIDGIWDEPGERIHSGFLSVGPQTIGVNVLPSAVPGLTYARFRISKQGGLKPEGECDNGEVEDYTVTIREEPKPKAELGDAPDSSTNYRVGMTAYPGIPAHYPTVYGTGSPPHGPIHWQPRDVAFLGQRVTLEDEADTGLDEDPTNNIIPPNDTADQDRADDGVIFPVTITHCDYSTLDYVVTVVNAPTADTPLYVNIWFDWNRDGDWDDRFTCPDGLIGEEWAVQNQELFFSGAGIYTVTSLPFLANALSSSDIKELWMRITLSERKYDPISSSLIEGYGGSGPEEGYQYGETEDYLFAPEIYIPPRYDFGDAPDQVGVTALSPYNYRTVLANNGARHVLGSNIFMSPANVAPDAEADGQPTINADGDDLGGIDDEDGVSFPNLPLIPGKTAKVVVEASQDCLLSAWIDFYLDGSFDQPEDKIFSDEPLTAGPNSLEFDVPLYAKQRVRTYARFRVSSGGGLNYYGEARDGEVEDYAVRIGRNINIKWMQIPDTTPDGIDIRVDTSDGIPRVLADDFLCSSVERITDVHLWGSWRDDRKGRIRRVHLSFHSDDPVGPGGSDERNIYSKPDELLWEKDFFEGEFSEKLFVQLEEKGEYWWDPFRGVVIPDGDKQIWQVDIDIKPEEAFVQKGTEDRPIVYWIDVQVDTDEGEFGWKTRRWPNHYNDDAVFGEDNYNWKELRYPAGHAHAPLMFEDLTVGTEYFVGDVITTSGTDIEVMPFEWTGGTSTAAGRAMVDNHQLAGGSGNDINCNNVNLSFDFPTLYNLDLLYGEYGGNVNLEINGVKRNVEDFDILNGTMVGGVMVTILSDPTATSANQKIMHLDGKIDSFSIGGQELWIDNVGSSSIDMAFALTGKRIVGDFDYSGSVDIVDALLIAQCFVGLSPCPPTVVGDVNCDGVIDIVDALLTAQYYVGLIPSLGC
jgi:hypothetical protein